MEKKRRRSNKGALLGHGSKHEVEAPKFGFRKHVGFRLIEPTYLTVSEAALYLGLSKRFFREHIDEIPHFIFPAIGIQRNSGSPYLIRYDKRQLDLWARKFAVNYYEGPPSGATDGFSVFDAEVAKNDRHRELSPAERAAREGGGDREEHGDGELPAAECATDPDQLHLLLPEGSVLPKL